MKMVTAIVQPELVDAVRQALIDAEITRITVSRCAGRGRAEDSDLYRGQKVPMDLLPKARIDIACNDDFVEITLDAILKAARTGKIGDGKVFVTPLERCIRIRTGEEGGEAI